MKLSAEDYHTLVRLRDKGFEWVARDRDGALFAHEEEPIKNLSFNEGEWNSLSGGARAVSPSDYSTLDFVSSGDKYPYNIKELILSHEDEEYGYFDMKLVREYEDFVKAWGSRSER